MKRPNLLLITSDQQHYMTLGLLNPHIHTPNLDRLARQGMLLERAYCPNPTCTPTRASIITGQYPSQHGAWTLGTKLPEDTPTVGDYLARGGYESILIGKAHFQPLGSTEEYPSLEAYPVLQDLDFWRNFHDRFYGFDRIELARNHVDEAHVGQHYALWMEEKGFTGWRECFQRPTGTSDQQYRHWNLPEEYHPNSWISERSVEHMRRCQAEGKPFFLWSSFFDPHPPYLVPAPWDRMYDPASIPLPEIDPTEHAANPPHFQLTQEYDPDFSAYRESGHGLHGMHSHIRSRAYYHPGWEDRDALAADTAIYYGMISFMDHHIGRILDGLDELGLTEQTLVVFTTDHGHLIGQHGLVAKGPFHYEDLIRVPTIARMPGMIEAGSRSSALVSLVDLAPTFLDVAGLGVPDRMSGRSLCGLLSGEVPSVRERVVVENRHERHTVHLHTMVEDRYKITVYLDKEYGEIFDLEADPGEKHNLWNDPAAAALKAALLLRLAHAHMDQAPRWMSRISGA